MRFEVQHLAATSGVRRTMLVASRAKPSHPNWICPVERHPSAFKVGWDTTKEMPSPVLPSPLSPLCLLVGCHWGKIAPAGCPRSCLFQAVPAGKSRVESSSGENAAGIHCFIRGLRLLSLTQTNVQTS